MSLMLAFALLGLPQDFNLGGDWERALGDSNIVKASEWNPDPEPSLASFGQDALRFSIRPALRGGEAIIVTILPNPQGDAVATIGIRRRQCAEPADCKLIFSRSARFAFCLEDDCNYARFARRIHALLFDVKRMRPAGGEPEICTDGPGYLTEIREGGQTYNLYGFCHALHPNNVVSQLVKQGAGKHWPTAPYLD